MALSKKLLIVRPNPFHMVPSAIQTKHQYSLCEFSEDVLRITWLIMCHACSDSRIFDTCLDETKEKRL